MICIRDGFRVALLGAAVVGLSLMTLPAAPQTRLEVPKIGDPPEAQNMLVGELLRGDGKRNTIGRLNALRAGNSIGRPA